MERAPDDNQRPVWFLWSLIGRWQILNFRAQVTTNQEPESYLYRVTSSVKRAKK